MGGKEGIREVRKMIEKAQGLARDLAEALRKKIGVLKVAQQTEVQDHTDRQEELFPAGRITTVDQVTPEVIAADGKQKQEHEDPAGLEVKEKADRQKIDRSEGIEPVYKGIEEQYQ
jgi:hypothetical protein